MKKHVIPVLMLVLCLGSAWASAADEIKLLKMGSIVVSRSGRSQQEIRFEALVANRASEKKVYAHVRGPGGVWFDVPLSYSRPASPRREIWRALFMPPLGETYDVRFVLKYVVDGRIYRDDNGGKNYFMAKESGNILAPGVNVYLAHYSPSYRVWDRYLHGTVSVRNLAYAKQVCVHYSTDNWATVKYADASFRRDYWLASYVRLPNPSPFGFEEWSFELDVGHAPQVVYAIQYRAGGKTYWDNNFGRDYRSTLYR